MLLASPIPVLALMDMRNLMPDRITCEMNNETFLIFGSLLSFYIPMVIMVTTYALTIHHLSSTRLCGTAGSRHVVSATNGAVTSFSCAASRNGGAGSTSGSTRWQQARVAMDRGRVGEYGSNHSCSIAREEAS